MGRVLELRVGDGVFAARRAAKLDRMGLKTRDAFLEYLGKTVATFASPIGGGAARG